MIEARPRGRSYRAAWPRCGAGGVRDSAAVAAKTDEGEQAVESEVLASMKQLSGGSTNLAMSGGAVAPKPAAAPYHVPGAHLRIAFQGEPGAYSG